MFLKLLKLIEDRVSFHSALGRDLIEKLRNLLDFVLNFITLSNIDVVLILQKWDVVILLGGDMAGF